MQNLRIVFAGTPDFAASHLHALLEAGCNIVAAYTQPDRPAGRGNKLTPSPVKTLAMQHHIPVEQPPSLKNEAAQQRLVDLQADLMIVVAYGLLLPQAVLDTPRLGCINVHGSLLPRWRGAAPIQRAIWAGDNTTGVTIMQMDAGLDTGPMLHKIVCDITANETSASLYNKLATLGPQGLLHTVEQLAKGEVRAEVQNHAEATYASKLSKDEARLDWQLPATQLERCIRAFNPWPVSFLLIDDLNIKIWNAETVTPSTAALPGTVLNADKSGIDIATADGVLRLLSLQPPGKKPMSAQELLNARRDWFQPGRVLA